MIRKWFELRSLHIVWDLLVATEEILKYSLLWESVTQLRPELVIFIIQVLMIAAKLSFQFAVEDTAVLFRYVVILSAVIHQ